MSTYPDFAAIAKRAVPVRADCYVCECAWTGYQARDEAMRHNAETRHPVWIECRPHSDDGPA